MPPNPQFICLVLHRAMREAQPVVGTTYRQILFGRLEKAPRSEGGRIKIIASYHADRRLLARTVIGLDNFNCTYILSWGEVRGLRGLL